MKRRTLSWLTALVITVSAGVCEAGGTWFPSQGLYRYNPVAPRNSAARPVGPSWRMYKEGDPVQMRWRGNTNPRGIELLVFPKQPLMAGPQPEPPRSLQGGSLLQRPQVRWPLGIAPR